MHCADFKGTVVAVTHDRYFLDNVAGWILELDRGAGIPFEGNYSEWLKAKEKRLAVSGCLHQCLASRCGCFAWVQGAGKQHPSCIHAHGSLALLGLQSLL